MFVCDLATSLIRDHGPGKLEWIQTNSIGVDAVATPEVAAAGVLVTNARGIFEQPIAEFVLASILCQVKDLRRTLEDQRRGVWNQRTTANLKGRRAVVVGAGGVGARIAVLLRAVGMDVEIVARTRRESGGSVDGVRLGPVFGADELRERLAFADDVVIAAPLTLETVGMMDAEAFDSVRPGAHFVNVGRGAIVNDDALLAALRSGRVAAATLDVFSVEPLPRVHPFWEMENVLISPHQSGDVHDWKRSTVELFVRNLRRWRAGEELENRVNTAAFLAGEPEADAD
ncbi:D-2-hydroxyacid dehydrogenase [Pseudoclavibacter terrae]